MDEIVHWVREDPSGLGRPWLSGTPASESMAVPMMLLNLVDQLGEAAEELARSYAELGDWCAQRILQHVQVGGRRHLLHPHPALSWAPMAPLYRQGDTGRPGRGDMQPRTRGRWRALGELGGAQGGSEGARAPGTSESRKAGQAKSSRSLWPAQPARSPSPFSVTPFPPGGEELGLKQGSEAVQALGSELACP